MTRLGGIAGISSSRSDLRQTAQSSASFDDFRERTFLFRSRRSYSERRSECRYYHSDRDGLGMRKSAGTCSDDRRITLRGKKFQSAALGKLWPIGSGSRYHHVQGERKDLADVPGRVREDLTIIPSTIDEVLVCLESGKQDDRCRGPQVWTADLPSADISTSIE